MTVFALDIILAKLPFETRKRLGMAAADPEFLIVNGWVLTREDMAASRAKRNVV